MNPVFDYTDYKKFLNDQIDRHESVRGYKSMLADAAGCQRSFMSQVLNGPVHITPDHALGLAGFWKMDLATTEFFLDLVNHGRAATPALRSHLDKKLKETRTKMRDSAVKIATPELTNIEHQSVYYSHWYWVAVHMLLQIKAYQAEKEIAERLHLPTEMVRQALSVLQNMGLAQKGKTGWTSTTKHIHATRDSIFSWLHHDSWRAKANESFRKRNPETVHFTGLYTLSLKDKAKIQDMVLELMDDTLKLVGPSNEEDLACLCIDWFEV